jgi:hypothetical protein
MKKACRLINSGRRGAACCCCDRRMFYCQPYDEEITTTIETIPTEAGVEKVLALVSSESRPDPGPLRSDHAHRDG